MPSFRSLHVGAAAALTGDHRALAEVYFNPHIKQSAPALPEKSMFNAKCIKVRGKMTLQLK